MVKKTTTKKTNKSDSVTDPKTPDSKAVAIIENQQNEPEIIQAPEQEDHGRESALSIVGGVTTPQLQEALKVQTEQRKLIQEFIQENLVEGVDYGKIHVIDSCPDEKRARGTCTKDYHFSKSILFKPGQEKIFSLFGITDELVKDQDAYDVLQVPGMVAYKCIMWRGKNRVGEGRGAATLSESQNKPNSCIKKAEKRARMDAVLSLGFSAYFTQDLDDPDYKSQRDHMNEKAKHEAEARDKDENGFLPRDPDEPIDNQERVMLHRLITKAGFDDQAEILEFLKSNGIADPAAMTSGEARKLITKMKATDFLNPEKSTTDDPVIIPPKPPEPMTPAELEVDEDLKTHIQEHYMSLNLNARGEMWFKKQVSGKPFGKWETFSDKDWRRAYQFVEDIQEGRVIPDPSHINSKMKADREVPANIDPETGEYLDIDPVADRDEDRAIQESLMDMDFNQENNEEDSRDEQ